MSLSVLPHDLLTALLCGMRLSGMRLCGMLVRGILTGALLAAAMHPAQAQEDPSSLERRVKAAFIYKFTDYVDWPEGTFVRPAAPVVIGVSGDEQVANELAQLAAAHTADSRQVAVRRLREGDPLAGLHVLFVGRADSSRMLQQARTAAAQPLLVVTESDGALKDGAIINFMMAAGRVRFEVALDNAEKRGLKLSSRLLTVAQSVRTAP